VRLLARAIASVKGYRRGDADFVVLRKADDFLKVLLQLLRTAHRDGSRIAELLEGRLAPSASAPGGDCMPLALEAFEELSLEVRGCTSLKESLVRFVGSFSMMSNGHNEAGASGGAPAPPRSSSSGSRRSFSSN